MPENIEITLRHSEMPHFLQGAMPERNPGTIGSLCCRTWAQTANTTLKEFESRNHT